LERRINGGRPSPRSNVKFSYPETIDSTETNRKITPDIVYIIKKNRLTLENRRRLRKTLSAFRFFTNHVMDDNVRDEQDVLYKVSTRRR